jgi:hypothetical protein
MPSRKELYQDFIYEIIYTVSINREWRRKLFESSTGTRFRLDAETLKETRGLQINFIEEHKLVYFVWRAENPSASVRFEFISEEFPDVVHSSWNNPET